MLFRNIRYGMDPVTTLGQKVVVVIEAQQTFLRTELRRLTIDSENIFV